MGAGMSRSLLPPQSAADRWLSRLCLCLPLLALLAFFGGPMLSILWHSLVDDRSGAVGLNNYVTLFDAPGVWRALGNSLLLGIATTIITLLLGFIVAYGLQFTVMPAKRFITFATALPVLAPSLVLGLGLIFLLGRNGIVGNILGVRLDIYGFHGLLIADVLYALPQAVLIIQAALRHSDARQYEAAGVLGASGWRQFLDITLPGVRFGLLSAGFVVFTITITDFGNAVVIGGDFPVLATEIYSQVSGQMKFGMGAVVGILLLLPAAAAIWIERAAARRQKMIGTASAQPYVPTPQRGRDILFWLLNMLISLAIVATITTVVMASLIRLWPYRLDLTLKHYNIDLAGATRRCGPLLGSRHWRPLSARCCCSCSPSAFAASQGEPQTSLHCSARCRWAYPGWYWGWPTSLPLTVPICPGVCSMAPRYWWRCVTTTTTTPRASPP